MTLNMKRVLDALPDVALAKRTFHDDEICLNNHETGEDENCLVRQWMVVAGGQMYSADACRKYAAELMDLAEQVEHLNNGKDITRMTLAGDKHMTSEDDGPNLLGNTFNSALGNAAAFNLRNFVDSVTNKSNNTEEITGFFGEPLPPLQEGDPTEDDMPQGIENDIYYDEDRIEDKDDDK